MTDEEKRKKIKEYSLKLLKLSRDRIVVGMRFMDAAVYRLKLVARENLRGLATDGENYYYDPREVLNIYDRSSKLLTRTFLHSILHCIFNHNFGYEKLDRDLWDISCDIAVENIIMELDLSAVNLPDDSERRMKLKGMRRDITSFTAEKIYRYFLINPPAGVDREKYIELFALDRHVYWQKAENYEISNEAWKRVSERIKADIKTFSKNSTHSESLISNLEEATKPEYNYRDILKRFSVSGEEIRVNDEEFDYIYYTYGLSTYGNMPLVEPLEFKDIKKIKDFAIVLDTSASCRGDIIRSFLIMTYEILKDRDNFFNHINVHIIQSDNEVHQDTKIKDQGDFDEFIKKGKLMGYGGTDYRPAIEYVDKLLENNEFTNFKGLIYFTDGYGIYPEKAPDYDCLFVFISEDDRKPELPWWVIPVIIKEDQLK
ncbi:MAG: VWA-like domain-containing protein [Lachnospiraceae bacterium]|nr:VWA-like domain-containing protein [Lachnospiraceae bacterium]